MANFESIKRRELLHRTGLLAICLSCGRGAAGLESTASRMRKIDPAEVGIRATGNDFDFVVFADPQGGDPSDTTNDSPERVAIHNPYIRKNVETVNRLDPLPAFLVVAGDIDKSKG